MYKEERNGFLIKQKHAFDRFPFAVSVNEKWVDSFETLEDAQGFCDEERPEYYEQD